MAGAMRAWPFRARVHRRQLGVQAERAVQLQHLIGLHGDGAAQAGIGGIADRRATDRPSMPPRQITTTILRLARSPSLAAKAWRPMKLTRDAEAGGQAQEGAAIGLSGHRR
jgi:hypothetical protein